VLKSTKLRRAFKSALVGAVSVGVVLSATTALAAKKKTAQAFNPCEGDFELSIKVEPVNSMNAEGEANKLGLSVSIPKKGAGGSIVRIHTGQKSQFSSEACLNWQKQYWSELSRALRAADMPERKKLICHNIAVLNIRKGAQSESKRVCLGNGRVDGTSFGVMKFYEGTDLLVKR
jgi:hypothetical protein